MSTKNKIKDTTGIKRTRDQHRMPHASVKEAVQKRITPKDHSSVIPGIDMNEIMHSLDLLRYALDYSEAIVDTVRLPLMVLNKKLQVLTANRSFYETFKLTPLETENKLIYKLNNSAWDNPKLRVLLEEILPKNKSFDNYEVEIDFPKIGSRTLILNARRTYRQVNNTEAMLLTFEDVTIRRELERQKDDFIGVVSHELRTPLTSIKVFSQLLEKYLVSNQDKKGTYYLSKMTNQIERLTELMASFVKVYQIQNGKLTLKKKKFDLSKLISALVLDFQYTADAHTVIYDINSEIIVNADKTRIAQVIINIISNAIKYSPNGSNVIIKTVLKNDVVTVSVQDFGYGIPAGEQDQVFERFFRAKGKREGSITGLGLGLYISYEIIIQHMGKIWVDSIDGKGSTFYFSLPLTNKK